MSDLAQRLLARHYSERTHPYRIFESRIDALVSSDRVLMDAGCGRTAPTLIKYRQRAGRLIGVDVVDFRDVPSDIETYQADLEHLPLDDGSVDLIVSRSVFEHLMN